LNVKANGEIISMIAAPRSATIFARSTIMHRLELGAMVDRFTQIHTISKQPVSRLAMRDDHCFRAKIFSQ